MICKDLTITKVEQPQKLALRLIDDINYSQLAMKTLNTYKKFKKIFFACDVTFNFLWSSGGK